MPTYRQQCACGFRFQHVARLADRDKPVPCPECGARTERLLPDRVEGLIDVRTAGVGPQNTGVASLDANMDRIAGIAAEQGWAFQEGRTRDKRALLRANPGADPRDISMNPDGSFGLLPKGMGPTLRRASVAAMAESRPDPSVPDDPDIPREPGFNVGG